jgi:hypothetical protein
LAVSSLLVFCPYIALQAAFVVLIALFLSGIHEIAPGWRMTHLLLRTYLQLLIPSAFVLYFLFLALRLRRAAKTQ